MGIIKKALSMLLVGTGVLALASCGGEEAPSATSTPAETPTDTATPDTKPSESTSIKDKFECITIARANELATEHGENYGKERFFIYGTIKEIIKEEYGNMTITDGTNEIYVYGVYSIDGKTKFGDLTTKPAKGDEIVISALLGQFKGKNQAKSGWLQAYKPANGEAVYPSAPAVKPTDTSKPADTSKPTNSGTANPDAVEMTISEARAAAKGASVKVTGIVAQVTLGQKKAQNGFLLVDDAASIYVYSNDSSVKVGNKVTLTATKDYYIGKKDKTAAEAAGYMGANQLKEAIIVSNDKKTTNAFNVAAANEVSIKSLLQIAATEDITGDLYKTTAIVEKAPGEGYINYNICDPEGYEKGGTANIYSYVYSQNGCSEFKWLDEFDGKTCTVYYTALNAKFKDGKIVYRLLPVKVEVAA